MGRYALFAPLLLSVTLFFGQGAKETSGALSSEYLPRPLEICLYAQNAWRAQSSVTAREADPFTLVANSWEQDVERA